MANNTNSQNNQSNNAPRNGDNSIPDSLKDPAIKKTQVRNLKTIIDNKLKQLEDLATMEVLLDVSARLRSRLKSIKKMSSARSVKVRGHWKTTNPQMHITKLRATKHSNDEAEITFSVYESDKEGNKVRHDHKTTIEQANGDKINRIVSSEYRIAYEVTETIRRNKPITREIVKLENIN